MSLNFTEHYGNEIPGLDDDDDEDEDENENENEERRRTRMANLTVL